MVSCFFIIDDLETETKMKKIEWTWKSFDGLEMFARGWLPDGNLKGVVYLVHGLGEHTGRYEHVGAAFNAAGYALLGADLRGHGKSGGARGHAPSWDAYFNDIDSMLVECERRYPSMPRFLYGHSLGGLIALSYSLSRKPNARGVIVSSPGLMSAIHEQKVKLLVAKILGSIAPTFTLPSELVNEHISRDPRVVQAYVSDPLVHDRITTSFGKAGLQATDLVFARAAQFPVPLLIAYGSADPIAFPRGSERFAALVPPALVTVKRYEGLYHEIHNEPEQAQVFKDYIAWLDAQVAR